ncbi:branched-chain amino acid ABC transporter substrate-binding protein [Mobilicoccus massiliensis]|uniref:branched-chain amino acid ABC transporter substrate-binding protein n=1 Tax=Mobilicoccus massiliensis TaxID=1522310 RepID=UPI00058DA83F|nr:branched-chain amino acid ABC transporter substrate-binding protein [Mobilicoccus massiliensis]
MSSRTSSRTVARVGVTLVAASLALSACGSRDSGGTSGGSGSGGGSGDKTAVIGVIAPLSGDLSAMGLGIQHSVELAVKQANDSKAIPGWTLKVEAKDDEAKTEPAKNAATQLASDNNVVGVVGTLNSSTAQTVQPVLASAKIPMVSPANTNPSLSRGADFANSPKRDYTNYFRTCTTDDVQGPFAAQYLLEKNIKSVATVHDKKTYGQGLVEAFSKEFAAKGGQVVAAETINPDDSNYQNVLSTITGKKPQAVYYGGEYPQGGPLSQQMKAGGLNVPLIGGDGLYNPKYTELAGATANGDMTTSVGAPLESLPKGKEFLEAYKTEKYDQEPGAYGAYAYDAANAIIEGLKTSLKDAADAQGARQATIDAIGKADFDGVTGKVSFDQYGDSKTRVLTVYEVKDGAWVAAKTGELK